MRALKKPDLSSGKGGIVDYKFIPELLRYELKLHMSADNQSVTDIEIFLDACGAATQAMTIDREVIGLSEEKRQIEAIANNARRLLASINATEQQTRDTFSGHCLALTDISIPPINLPKRVITDLRRNSKGETLLEITWDYLQALEQAALYAANQITPSKQSKPDQVNGSGLTAKVVDAYFRVFKSLPPADRAGWFAGFMKCLGDHYGVACGPRIVSSAITGHKKYTLIGK